MRMRRNKVVSINCQFNIILLLWKTSAFKSDILNKINNGSDACLFFWVSYGQRNDGRWLFCPFSYGPMYWMGFGVVGLGEGGILGKVGFLYEFSFLEILFYLYLKSDESIADLPEKRVCICHLPKSWRYNDHFIKVNPYVIYTTSFTSQTLCIS